MNFHVYEPYIKYLIFGFIISFFECYCLGRDRIFAELKGKIIPINGDLPSSTLDSGDYVYYQTDNMTYSILTDELFGISHQCGRLERKVQYCQWREYQHSRTVRQGNTSRTEYYYTYHKQWSHYQISSIFFHNKLYWNPKVGSVAEVKHISNNTKAGMFTIGPEMRLNGKIEYYYPDSEQIDGFRNSEADTDFLYTEKGIFYSPYKRKLLDKLLRTAQFFDLKGDLVDWCTPGDRRVWFEAWKPASASVVGSINQNFVIEPFTFKKFEIGSVHSGKVELLSILKDNASAFPTVMKWICRTCVVLYFAYGIYKNSPDIVYVTSLCLVVFACYLTPTSINRSVWASVLLSFALGLAVFFAKFYEDEILDSFDRFIRKLHKIKTD